MDEIFVTWAYQNDLSDEEMESVWGQIQEHPDRDTILEELGGVESLEQLRNLLQIF